MNKAKASLLSEDTLWSLYRRTLGASLLAEQLGRGVGMRENAGPAAAAAVTEALRHGDMLGLMAGDRTTRFAAGQAAEQLRSVTRRAKASVGFAHEADPGLPVLPAHGNAQAMVALGAAMAMKQEQGEHCVVLLARADARPGAAGADAFAMWAEVAELAAEYKLPLVFVAERRGASPTPGPGPRRAAPRMPSIPVDRQDALAMYRVLYEATARAREGAGPTWAECCEPRLADGTMLDGDKDAVAKLTEAMQGRKVFHRDRARVMRAALERKLQG